MPKPLNDLVAFLTAGSGDYDAFGAARYVILLVLYGLLAANLVLLVINLKDDRGQRSGRSAWLWLVRLAVGCLFFQGMLRTLPFGSDNPLHGWTALMAENAAFPSVADAVTGTVLPHYGLYGPLAFLASFGIAAGFILGLFVRIAGFLGAVVALWLWAGLSGAATPDTPLLAWGLVVLALVCGTLAVFSAGRALGADAWIRRVVPAVRDRRASGVLLRVLT